MPGPLVAPGTYVIRLVAGGRTLEQKVEVREDPRIDVSPAERKQWTDAVQQAAALAREFGPVNDRIQKLPGTGADVVGSEAPVARADLANQRFVWSASAAGRARRRRIS